MSVIYLFDILFIYIFTTLIIASLYFSLVKRSERASDVLINTLITGASYIIIRNSAILALSLLSRSKNLTDFISNVFIVITAIFLLIILILAVAKEDERVEKYNKKIKITFLTFTFLTIISCTTAILLKTEAIGEPQNPPPIAQKIEKSLKEDRQ